MPGTGVASRVAVAAVVLIALSSCATEIPMPTPTPSESFAVTGDGVLRIGTLFALTGPAAAAGASQVAGVELAVRDINLAGGVAGAPVEVFHRNSGDESTGTAEASLANLVALGVDVVIGPPGTSLLERLAGPAAEAGVVLVSPGATLPASGDASESPTPVNRMVFSLAAPYSAQSATLATEIVASGASRVALVAVRDTETSSLGAPLGDALDAAGAQLSVVTEVDAAATEFARMRSSVKKARADAIVIATPPGSDALAAAIAAELRTAGFSSDSLWFTTGNTVSFASALPAGTLEGAWGIREAGGADAEFSRLLRQSDPGLAVTTRATEAYDAVVLAALAAVVGEDDGGSSIARALRGVAGSGIPCRSFDECVDVLRTEVDIDYNGKSGDVDLTDLGGVLSGRYELLRYGPENEPKSEIK